jgi:predicted alpha/beta-hydrolase family hydrolase
MPTEILWDAPAGRHAATLVLAHGAGAPMDNGWMNDMAALIAERGIRVARFEFEYMASRRRGVRRPPPRADTILGEYRAVVEGLGTQEQRLLIGGKSMGGRVASMVADQLHDAGSVSGLVCLGYPFHPPAKPDQLRTAHLAGMRTPALICQGTRDPFGTREEVAGYALSPAIEVLWLEDGDHDLRPRKAVSGFTYREHLTTTADAVARFAF